MIQKTFKLIDTEFFRQVGSAVQERGTLQNKGAWPKELENSGVRQRDQLYNTTVGYEAFFCSGSEIAYRLVSDDLKVKQTDTDHAIVNLVSELGTVFYRGVGTLSHIFGENGHMDNRDYLRPGTSVFPTSI